jgi:hypothetical protein
VPLHQLSRLTLGIKHFLQPVELRRWMREASTAPVAAFPGNSQ